MHVVAMYFHIWIHYLVNQVSVLARATQTVTPPLFEKHPR